MRAMTPLPAATVVVVREGARDPLEVFLVKRHGRSGFMAGAHVFPGGRVDEGDRAFAERLSDRLLEAAAAHLDQALPTVEAAAFALAAVRETAEECGLLLARDAGGALPGADVADEVFRALQAGEPFAALLSARGLVPDLEALAPLAWWITPEAEPKRFDTRFFLARAPSEQRARADLKETTEGEWLSPLAALSAYEAGRIHLAPPTLATLEDLAPCDSFDAARQTALRPARPCCPKLIPGDEGLVLALPGDPLHDEPERALRGERTRVVMTPEGRFRSESIPRLATSD